MVTQTTLLQRPVDESIIREQVLSTHNYDGRRFNTNFILNNVENIFSFEMGTAQEVRMENFNQLEELNNYEQEQLLPFLIKQLSFEIMSDLNATNEHSTTIHHVLRMVSWYSWEDKLVLMLAAFSIIYGEFNLISGLCKHKGIGLADKLRHLKKSCPILTHNQKAIVDCMGSAIQLTKCLVELKQWSSYSPSRSALLALPMATYWIATSVVNSVAAYAYDAHFKVQNELGELTTLILNMLAIFSPELEKKKAEESFEALRHALYHNSSNKLEVFKLMFNVKNEHEPIFRGTGLLAWKNDRTVLLLITSGFDISDERIDFLTWFYNNSTPFMIWIPITQNVASWTIEDEQKFEKLKAKMYRLYWLNDPQKRLLPQFTRFVKEVLFPEFQMEEEAIIVSVDMRGRIVHPNVMHMLLTWTPAYIQNNTVVAPMLSNITPFIVKEMEEGASSIKRVVPEIDKMISDFVHDIGDKINAWRHLVEDKIQKAMELSTPYDIEREQFLWQQETAWSLHLMVPQVGHYYAYHELIKDWIQEEKYIFLYGGNDIKWVREFTSKVSEVSLKTQVNLELAYIGQNKQIRAIINNEGMSHCLLYNSRSVWLFWTRLHSMFLSRIRYLYVNGHSIEEYNNDDILQGVKKLLAYERKNATIGGWALLSKGPKVIVCGHGTKMLQAMNDYKIWKESIGPISFGQAFKDHYEMVSVNHHFCCTFEYPIILSKILEKEKCPECSRCMHKFSTFTCCHGHDGGYNEDE